MKHLLHYILLFLFVEALFSQTNGQLIVDVNNVRLPVNNDGKIGTIFINGNNEHGTYENIRFLSKSGFYLSGYNDDSLWSN